MVIGALIAAVVGAVLGLAVIRLPGIYAALATLAFALFFAGVMVPLTWVSGGNGSLPLTVPRPSAIGPISFESDRAFLILAVIILALLGVATIAIRQGTTGRFLDAVRGSESAAAAVGISATRQRLIVFIGRRGGGRIRRGPAGQLPPPGQLQRRLRVLRRPGVGGAGHHRRLAPGAIGRHLGHHLLPAARPC